jgi:hypothetical protein
MVAWNPWLTVMVRSFHCVGRRLLHEIIVTSGNVRTMLADTCPILHLKRGSYAASMLW